MNYNISLNAELATIVEREMKRRKFSNRSEFFRDLVRSMFVDVQGDKEELQPGDPDYAIARRDRYIPGARLYTLDSVRGAVSQKRRRKT